MFHNLLQDGNDVVTTAMKGLWEAGEDLRFDDSEEVVISRFWNE